MKKALIWMFLIVISAISLLPFYLMIMMSTYVTEDIFKGLPFLPGTYMIENFRTVFSGNYFQVFGNSVIVSFSAVLLSVITSALIGYAIAKFQFRLKNILNYFIIITMMVPTQVGLIGYIIEMRNLGLGNSLWPIILIWMAFPFGAFFMVQFIKDSVPTEIIECARIDGCSEPGIFFRIVMPLIRLGLATLATLVFLWSWNNYLLPLVTINHQSLFTIPMYVSNLGIVHRTDYAARMAALTIATVPVLIVFLLGSRTFIKGITAGAVKG